MARLRYLEVDDLDPDNRSLLDRPINLAKILVHSPGGARAFNRLGGWIRFKSEVDPRLRELAILRVGVLAANEYEFSHHVKLGLEFGLSHDDIDAVVLGPDAPGLSELERLVVVAADEATVAGAMAADTVVSLRSALGEQQTVELTIIISFYNAVVRFLSSLAIDVEDDYRTYLERHPLHASGGAGARPGRLIRHTPTR